MRDGRRGVLCGTGSRDGRRDVLYAQCIVPVVSRSCPYCCPICILAPCQNCPNITIRFFASDWARDLRYRHSSAREALSSSKVSPAPEKISFLMLRRYSALRYCIEAQEMRMEWVEYLRVKVR